MTDRFDEVFALDGGRFEPTIDLHHRLLERANGWLEKVRNDSNTRPSLPPLTIGLVSNTTLNAAATLEPDGAFIGINEGAIIVLFDLFNRMLAHALTFPRVGDPTQEITYPTLASPCFDAQEMIDQLEHNGPLVPKNGSRAAFADLMLTTAFDFLVLHETAHVLHGHLGLFGERGFAKAIYESEIFAGEGEKPHYLQTLEMDADCFAVSQLCGFHIDLLKHVPSDVPSDFPVHTLGQRLFMINAAIYSWLRLLGFGKNSASNTHPAPPSRRMLAGSTAYEFIRSRFGSNIADEVIPDIGGAVKECEEAFSAISGVATPVEELRASLTEANFSCDMEIVRQWNDLLPDLERLAFTNKLVRPT